MPRISGARLAVAACLLPLCSAASNFEQFDQTALVQARLGAETRTVHEEPPVPHFVKALDNFIFQNSEGADRATNNWPDKEKPFDPFGKAGKFELAEKGLNMIFKLQQHTNEVGAGFVRWDLKRIDATLATTPTSNTKALHNLLLDLVRTGKKDWHRYYEVSMKQGKDIIAWYKNEGKTVKGGSDLAEGMYNQTMIDKISSYWYQPLEDANKVIETSIDAKDEHQVMKQFEDVHTIFTLAWTKMDSDLAPQMEGGEGWTKSREGLDKLKKPPASLFLPKSMVECLIRMSDANLQMITVVASFGKKLVEGSSKK